MRPIGPEPDQASENLVGAGRRITALVGREVKRTFSKEPQFSTGLSREKTLKADRQKVGNFIQVISIGGASVEHWNHPVARLQMLSLLRKNQKNLSLSERDRKGNKRYAKSVCLRHKGWGYTMAKKVKKKKFEGPPAALIQPIGNGYMPLFSALLWIATKGFNEKPDQPTDATWTDAYRQLVNAIASEKVKAMGWSGPVSEEIPAAYFASCAIVRFWDGYSEARASSGEMYLRGGFYANHAQWIDNSDELVVGVKTVWKQIVVRKSDVGREWPCFPVKCEDKIPEGSPTPTKAIKVRAGAVAPTSLLVQFDPGASTASILGLLDLQPAATKLLLVFQQAYVTDERVGKTLENCTCLSGKELAEELGLDEVAVRQAVSRLRSNVRKAYNAKYGSTPSEDSRLSGPTEVSAE
jgi:hypothetical protein